MSATAALSAASVAPFAGGDSTVAIALTAAIAIVVGVLGLLAGLLRLGFIAAFISEPVLKGFIVGLGVDDRDRTGSQAVGRLRKRTSTFSSRPGV